jgi:hypothetical protein
MSFGYGSDGSFDGSFAPGNYDFDYDDAGLFGIGPGTSTCTDVSKPPPTIGDLSSTSDMSSFRTIDLKEPGTSQLLSSLHASLQAQQPQQQPSPSNDRLLVSRDYDSSGAGPGPKISIPAVTAITTMTTDPRTQATHVANCATSKPNRKRRDPSPDLSDSILSGVLNHDDMKYIINAVTKKVKKSISDSDRYYDKANLRVSGLTKTVEEQAKELQSHFDLLKELHKDIKGMARFMATPTDPLLLTNGKFAFTAPDINSKMQHNGPLSNFTNSGSDSLEDYLHYAHAHTALAYQQQAEMQLLLKQETSTQRECARPRCSEPKAKTNYGEASYFCYRCLKVQYCSQDCLLKHSQAHVASCTQNQFWRRNSTADYYSRK